MYEGNKRIGVFGRLKKHVLLSEYLQEIKFRLRFVITIKNK